MRFLRLFLMSFLLASASRAESDPLQKMAADLADDVSRYPKLTIAVLAISYPDQHLSDGPTLVSERLTGFLSADKRLHVLERHHIDRVLRELKLSQIGFVDPTTAQHVGEALGADAVVTGSLIDLSHTRVEVNVRGVRSDNGRVLAANRAVIPRLWDARPKIGAEEERARSNDLIKTLARKLKEALVKHGSPLVSVLSFTYYNEQVSTGSDLVAERLVTYLTQAGVPVVERRLLPQLLDEWRLWQSGVAKPGTLKSIGEIVGAPILVAGTLSDRADNTTDVIARVIDAATGEVLAAAYALIAREWNDRPKPALARFNQVAVPMTAAPAGLVRVKPVTGGRVNGSLRHKMSTLPMAAPVSLERVK